MSTNKNNEGYEETLPQINLPDFVAAFKNTKKLLALEKYLGFPSPQTSTIDVMQKNKLFFAALSRTFKP